MKTSIKELAYGITQTSETLQLPVFIANRKTAISEDIQLINGSINTVQLAKTSNIIDYDSIIANITYWQQTSEVGSVNNNGSSVTDIGFITNIYDTFDDKSLFVVYDDSYNLIYISNMSNVIYSSEEFISATLSIPITFTGTYNYCFIKKTNVDLPVLSQNLILNQITLDLTSTDIFSAAKNDLFPILTHSSTIKYNTIINEYSVTEYSSVTDDMINDEDNIILQEALKCVPNKCIIISYPNDDYIYQLIDTLSNLPNGYYLVPIDVSKTFYQLLSSRLLTLQNENAFLSILLPTIVDNFEQITLVENTSFTCSSSFIITASAGVGGVIAGSGMVIVPTGTNETFWITADSGYMIMDVLVDGVSVGGVDTYVFYNVMEAHTIEATFSALH